MFSSAKDQLNQAKDDTLDGAQRIKGYQPAEVIGRHYSMFFQREDVDHNVPQRALETVVREGRYEGQGWRLRKDGTGFLAHVVIDPIKNELGELVARLPFSLG